jgi:hypothetical protein
LIVGIKKNILNAKIRRMIYNFLKGRGNLRIEKQMLELRKERG